MYHPHHHHLSKVILQCKYVDKDSRLDVVEKEEFGTSPDQDVVSVCRIKIRL